jgi:hypothetical protein
MKKILFVLLLLCNSSLLFAQNAIPGPTSFTASIAELLKHKAKDSIMATFVTWKEIEPLYDTMVSSNYNNMVQTKDLPSKDTMKQEIDIKLMQEGSDNIDSLFKRGERFGIDWNKIVFKDDAYRITKGKWSPAQLIINDGTIEFKSGDSLYSVGYTSILINNCWKLMTIEPGLTIYDNNGITIGRVYSSYNDYSSTTTDSTMIDSAVVMDSTKIDSTPVVKKVRHTTKGKTKKKSTASSATKQYLRKPENN